MMNEIQDIFKEVNKEINGLVSRYEKDLELAKKIQKALLPKKFPEISGIRFQHKYLSGLKSGGDYFDIFEFKDKNYLGILMSDSTGYGVSSMFVNQLMKMTNLLVHQPMTMTSEVIQKICSELQKTMKSNEDLSVFFGVLDRRTLRLRYTGFGSISFFYTGFNDKQIKDHISDHNPCTMESKKEFEEMTLSIRPGKKIILSTDGFKECARSGNYEKILKNVDEKDTQDFVNDLTYEVKSQFTEEDDLPNQDCSVVIMEFEEKILRLAKG